VLGLHVALDLDRQLAVQIERRPGSRAHHEEGDRDDQEQRRNGHQQAAAYEAQHQGLAAKGFSGARALRNFHPPPMMSTNPPVSPGDPATWPSSDAPQTTFP